jgi:hypothetical protein
MTAVRMFLFGLLAPALLPLAGLVFISHVAAHVLIDRMRREDARSPGPERAAAPRRTSPAWSRT